MRRSSSEHGGICCGRVCLAVCNIKLDRVSWRVFLAKIRQCFIQVILSDISYDDFASGLGKYLCLAESGA
jgi:hypothetical protein